jgi:hypothetical protein
MTRGDEMASGCALCMIDGILSKPIKNWPYFPICREHMAETLAKISGEPVIASTIDLSSQSQSLQ